MQITLKLHSNTFFALQNDAQSILGAEATATDYILYLIANRGASHAAAVLGSVKSERKAESCRANARKPRLNAQGKKKPRRVKN